MPSSLDPSFPKISSNLSLPTIVHPLDSVQTKTQRERDKTRESERDKTRKSERDRERNSERKTERKSARERGRKRENK